MEICGCGVCGEPLIKEVLEEKIYECNACDTLEDKEGHTLKNIEILNIVAEEFKDVITRKDLEEIQLAIERSDTYTGVSGTCRKNKEFDKKIAELKERQVEKGFSKKGY